MARLSRKEKETVITFNEHDSGAIIFTCSHKWQERMKKSGLEPIEDNGFGGLTYKIPKKAVRMPVIRKSKRLTTDQKAAIRKRLVDGKAAKLTKNVKKTREAAKVTEAEKPSL